MAQHVSAANDVTFINNVAQLRYSSLFPHSPMPSRDVLSSSFLTSHNQQKDVKKFPATHESIYGLGDGKRRLLYTALHQSILDGRLHQTELLVRKCDADVNVQDMFRRTPSMLCCILEDENLAIRLMKVLTFRGRVRFDIRDALGRTALAYACIYGRTELCHFFLEHECDDFGDGDNDKNTPLHHAARQGNMRIIEMLIKAYQHVNMDIDKRNHLGYTALLVALKALAFDAAALLLTLGCAVPTVRDNEFFLNAQEWYDKMMAMQEKRHQNSSKSHGSHSQRTANMQIRPAFLTERANTQMSSFYRNFLNPALRDSMLQTDFHSFSGIPQIPPSSREMTKIHLGETISVAVEEPDQEATTVNRRDDAHLSSHDIMSMSSADIHKIIKKYVQLPSQQPTKPVYIPDVPKSKSHSQLFSVSKSAAQLKTQVETPPKIRPETAKLLRYRVPTSCSTTETMRRLLTVYSHAATAPPSAQKEVTRKAGVYNRKTSMMKFARMSLFTNSLGTEDKKSSQFTVPPSIDERKSMGMRFS